MHKQTSGPAMTLKEWNEVQVKLYRLQTVQARAKAGKGSHARMRSWRSSGSVPHKASSMGATLGGSISIWVDPATPAPSSSPLSSNSEAGATCGSAPPDRDVRPWPPLSSKYTPCDVLLIIMLLNSCYNSPFPALFPFSSFHPNNHLNPMLPPPPCLPRHSSGKSPAIATSPHGNNTPTMSNLLHHLTHKKKNPRTSASRHLENFHLRFTPSKISSASPVTPLLGCQS